ICRTTFLPPQRDRKGYDSTIVFGSAHVATLNIAHCDGSVRAIPYTIAPEVWKAFGNRKIGANVYQ
ncbi:MAG: DUF1559 domain-containing protein, partial [Planctomycetota bacterium]|nr:DUF1559 domain-containing protein [Planctomycetota bacterium]